MNSIDEQVKIRFAREAGAVRRLHNRPIIGHYDVAQHTFNILAMLRVLHPDPSRELIWACFAHDLPERFTGDISAPAKWGGCTNEKRIQQIEHHTLRVMGFSNKTKALTGEDLWWLKGLDMLEFLLFCAEQKQLGNNCLHDQWNKGILYMEHMAPSLPWQIMNFLRHAQRGWGTMVLGEMQDYPLIMEHLDDSSQ